MFYMCFRYGFILFSWALYLFVHLLGVGLGLGVTCIVLVQIDQKNI